MRPVEAARRFAQERMPSRGILTPVAIGLLGVAVISGCAPVRSNQMINCAGGPRQAVMDVVASKGEMFEVNGTKLRNEGSGAVSVDTSGPMPDAFIVPKDGGVRLVDDAEFYDRLPGRSTAGRIYDVRADGTTKEGKDKIVVSAYCKNPQ